MKKNIFLGIILTTFLFTACGKSEPKRIEGLIVPNCEQLVADLGESNPNATTAEIYTGAADILFSDDRKDEAIACCENISDTEEKAKCNRGESL